MAGPVEWCSPDNHACSFVSRPFVKTIGGDQAPAKFQRIAEGGSRSRRFRPRIDHPGRNRRVFRPRRNQSPADKRQFPHRLLRMLADDGDRLGRGDVETGTPIFFARNGIEVFFENLLSPRQSVAPAHRKIMADSLCPQNRPKPTGTPHLRLARNSFQ